MHENSGLSGRLEDVSEYTGLNAGNDCLFVSDAYDYGGTGADGLTTEQYAIVRMTESVSMSEIGRTFLDGAISYDPETDTVDPTLVCVNNGMEPLGLFTPDYDLIEVDLENTFYDPETGMIGGINSVPQVLMQDGVLHTYVMNTYMEELAHGYQAFYLDNFDPSYDQFFHPADEKVWNLAVEAQAKVMGAVGIVEYEAETGKNIVEPFVQEFQGTVAAEMVGRVKSLYDQHGAEFIHENPEYLAPVFESFFHNAEALDAYYAQGADYINGIDSLDRVSIEHFEQAFGQIPGFEAGMLDGRYSSMEDLADIMPEGRTKSFLQESFDAAHNGEVGPRIEAPQQPGPSNAPGMAPGA